MNRGRHGTGPNPGAGKRSVGRRRVRSLPCLIAALALATPAALISRPQPTAAATPAVADGRPNIVFISTDDMRVADLPAMPNVRNLIAARGTNFTTSYIPFPLCCPSRAAWLTGQYNHNNGVMGNLSSDSPVGGYPALDNTNTLATWLREGGYQTAYVGRYLHGYGGKVVPPGWQEWHAVVGHNDWFNPLMRENATGTLASTTYTGQYLTDKIDTTSNTVIRDRVPGVAPFFLWVSHFAPHAATLPTEPDDPRFSSPVVPPRYKDFYANTPVPADPSYNEADVTDKPTYVRNRARFSAEVQADIQELNAQRWESLKAVDDSVRNIVNTLTVTGEINNTVIVFSSDNGYMMGEHRLPAGKIVHFDPSSRVPLIIRGPGFPAGTVRNQLVANIDLAPTLADLANIVPKRVVDGRSLLPLVSSPRTWPGRKLALEAGPTTIDGPDLYHGVRTARWKYIRHSTGEHELYDMVADPHELTSLANDPAYDATEASLDRITTRLATCKGEPNCR